MTSIATDPAAARHERLAEGVGRVRLRGGFDLERAMQIGGSILLPTGLIVILLGWYGAAHTSYEFEQLPYVISGGLLGAAMTVVGGFLYFGYWLTRIVHEEQRQRHDLVEVLTRLEGRLATLERPSATSTAALVTTLTGSLVHRADCALVRGKDVRALRGGTDGLKGCKVCHPFDGEG